MQNPPSRGRFGLDGGQEEVPMGEQHDTGREG